MPATPYAKILWRRNGGGWDTGVVDVDPGDTIELTAESKVGWPTSPAARWRLVGYPPGFGLPAGWSLNVDGYTYEYVGNTDPPAFAMPAWPEFGKILPQLVILDGSQASYSDATSGFRTLSPNGLDDVAPREEKQFGPVGYALAWQNIIRSFDASISSGGSTTGPVWLPVRFVTTADVPLSGLGALPEGTPSSGDRILVAGQATGTQNGLYVAAAGAWTRCTDADVSADFVPMKAVAVREGALHAGTVWHLRNNSFTLGVTAAVFDKTLRSNVVDSGGSADLVLNRNGVARLTLTALGVLSAGSMVAATGAEVAHRISATVNKATSGDDTVLEIAQDDVASPGMSRILDILAGAGGAARKLSVLNTGAIVIGPSGALSITQTQAASGAGAAALIKGQKAFAGVGGKLTLGGGDGATPGTNLAGETEVDLGAAVAGISAKLRLLESGASFLDLNKQGSSAVLQAVGAHLVVFGAFQAIVEAQNGLGAFNATSDLYLSGASQIFRSAAAVTGLTLVVAPTGASSWTWVAGVTSILETQSSTATGNGADWTDRAQGSGGGNGNGGHRNIQGGARNGTGLRGGVRLQLNGTTETIVEATEVASGRRVLSLLRSANVTTTDHPANAGDLVANVGDAATAPTAAPGSGFVFFGDGGRPAVMSVGKVLSALAAKGVNISTSVPIVDLGMGRVTTTDATANQVIATTPTIPTGTWAEVEVEVGVYQTGGAAGTAGDGAVFRQRYAATRAAGALTAITGAADEAVVAPHRIGLTTASIRIVVNGSNQFSIEATGEVDKDLTWFAKWRLFYFTA